MRCSADRRNTTGRRLRREGRSKEDGEEGRTERDCGLFYIFSRNIYKIIGREGLISFAINFQKGDKKHEEA